MFSNFRNGRWYTGSILFIFYADILPPVVTNKYGGTGWVPTITLTTFIRQLPTTKRVFADFKARDINKGYFEQDCNIWDLNVNLAAELQLTRILKSQRKLKKKDYQMKFKGTKNYISTEDLAGCKCHLFTKTIAYKGERYW